MPPDCVFWCKFIFSRSLSLFSVIHMYFYLELCQSNFFPVCLYLIWRSINSCSLVFLMSWLNYSDSATSELYKEASWLAAAVAAAKSFQSCPTLWDPIDDSPPGSPVPGILQARTLEWGAVSFSNAWKWKVKVKSFSHVRLLATPWTAAYQAPPSMGFSRQEYWSGVPLSSPQISLHKTYSFMLK